MGEITVNGVEMHIRSLKRFEVKALKKKGYIVGAIPAEKVDDSMDEMFSMVLTPEQIDIIDAADYIESLKVWLAIQKTTLGNDAETKNS